MTRKEIYNKYQLQPITRQLAINKDNDRFPAADDIPYFEIVSKNHTVDSDIPAGEMLVELCDDPNALYTVPAGSKRPVWPDDFKPFDPRQDYIIYSRSEPDLHFVDITTVRSFYDRQQLTPFRFVRVSEPQIVGDHGEFLCTCDTIPGLYRFLYVLCDDLPLEEAWNPEEIPDGIEKVKED